MANSSWEDIARETEIEYFKVKEALEECWDEIDRLEQDNAYQRQEIASLKQQLAASVPQEIRAGSVPSVSSTSASIGSSQSQSIASMFTAANYFQFQSTNKLQWANELNEAPKNTTCSVFETSIERLSKDSKNTSCSGQQHVQLDCLQKELKESNKTRKRLESELEEVKTTMRVRLEEKQHVSEKLEEQNCYLEEKIMNLQLQLASYLLSEAKNGAHSRRQRDHNDFDDRIDDVSVTRSDLDSGSESSSRSKDSHNPTPRRSFTIAFPNILQRDRTETEKELLRQLEFVQEEKHMDVLELENKLQDRDALIIKCKRTIAMQEEAIQNLQKKFVDDMDHRIK